MLPPTGPVQVGQESNGSTGRADSIPGRPDECPTGDCPTDDCPTDDCPTGGD
ncbi:hypothetical protein GCM10009663_62880 [Kitasatospora arboriphila]|uniref:Uncharacterized protein n=1 Tax=Kitasatospora arboriphila TaxID=258052 RepID=A0ABN1U3W4_9ACTN